MTDSALFARTGKTSTLGKMTAEIPKMKVPDETKDILDGLARDAGMGLTEFCKQVLMVRAHGVDVLLSLEQERIRIVAGMGSEEGYMS